MRKSYVLLISAVVIAAGSVPPIGLAQTPARTEPTAAATAAATAAKRQEADLANSRVYIKVISTTRFGHDHGVAGQLESGWVKPGAGGKLVFAMKTFVADTADAREYVGLTAPIKLADRKKASSTMRGPDVLDVNTHANATFAIKTFDAAEGQATGASGLYDLGGTFTLHGVSRPLTMKARLEPTTDPRVSRLRGSFSILQSEYGITPYSALGGLVGIKDKLDIRGELVFRTPDTREDASAPKSAR